MRSSQRQGGRLPEQAVCWGMAGLVGVRVGRDSWPGSVGRGSFRYCINDFSQHCDKHPGKPLKNEGVCFGFPFTQGKVWSGACSHRSH